MITLISNEWTDKAQLIFSKFTVFYARLVGLAVMCADGASSVSTFEEMDFQFW